MCELYEIILITLSGTITFCRHWFPHPVVCTEIHRKLARTSVLQLLRITMINPTPKSFLWKCVDFKHVATNPHTHWKQVPCKAHNGINLQVMPDEPCYIFKYLSFVFYIFVLQLIHEEKKQIVLDVYIVSNVEICNGFHVDLLLGVVRKRFE